MIAAVLAPHKSFLLYILINTFFLILSLLLWGRAPSGRAEMGGGARLCPVPLPLALLSGVLVLRFSRSGFAFSRPLPPRRAPLVYHRFLNVHRLAYGLQASPLPVPSLFGCRLGCVSVVDVPSLWLRHAHDAFALTRSCKDDYGCPCAPYLPRG